MTDATCRICGDGSSVASPLYHPCKCSGSIRYIHEECLIKWISVKSNSSKARAVTPAGSTTATGLSCEICSYQFEFAPVLSPDYKGDSLRTSFSLFFEVVRGIISSTLRRVLIPFLKLFSCLVFVPLLAGLVATSAASSFPNAYLFEYSFLVDNIGKIFSVGCLSVAIALVPCGGFGPTWCLASAPIVGTLGWILCIYVGRVLVTQNLALEPFFSSIDEDLVYSIYGVASAGILFGIGCVFVNRTSMISSITAIYRGVCMVITPLAVGVSVVMAASWETISGQQATISTGVVYLGIGSMVLAPLFLFNKFFWQFLMLKPTRRKLKRMHPVAVSLLGRKKFTDPSLDAVMEIGVAILFGQMFGWGVVGRILARMDLLPEIDMFGFDFHKEAYDGLHLPLELFYAHILVPLVLTVPPVPDCVETAWGWVTDTIQAWTQDHDDEDRGSMSSMGQIIKILVVRQLVLNVSLLGCVAVPNVAGRIVLGRSDLVAFSIGALAMLALIHFAFRLLHAFERMHAFSFKYLIRVCGLSVVVGVVGLGLVPISVGFAFQFAVVVPLKELHDPSPIKIALVVGESESLLRSVMIHLIPVWIIGLMMLKVGLAVLALGGSHGSQVRNFIQRYNDCGLLDEELQGTVWRFSQFILKKLALHAAGPVVVGILLEKGVGLISEWVRKHFLAGYLILYVLVVGVAPMVARWLMVERQAAFNKKFILKQQLRNLDSENFADDSLIFT